MRKVLTAFCTLVSISGCTTSGHLGALVRPGSDKSVREAEYLDCVKSTASVASGLPGAAADLNLDCMRAKGWKFELGAT